MDVLYVPALVELGVLDLSTPVDVVGLCAVNVVAAPPSSARPSRLEGGMDTTPFMLCTYVRVVYVQT